MRRDLPRFPQLLGSPQYVFPLLLVLIISVVVVGWLVIR